MPSYGHLDLLEEPGGRFTSEAPPDSAGEFQWQLGWTLDGARWVWSFHCGLSGTKSKGGSLTWTLLRSAEVEGS